MYCMVSAKNQQKKLLTLAVISLTCVLCTASFTAKEADSVPYLRTDVRGAEAIHAEVARFGNLLSGAVKEARARLTESGVKIINRDTGMSSHPITIQDVLPFRWLEIRELLPLDLFRADPEAALGLGRNNIVQLLESFNIQFLSTLQVSEWPAMATLTLRLEKYDGSISHDLEAIMSWRQNSSAFYLTNAFETHESMIEVIHELTPKDVRKRGGKYKPTLQVLEISGFDLLASQIERTHFSSGIPVTHSLRFGEVRLATNFSWLGRPREVLELHPPQLIQ